MSKFERSGCDVELGSRAMSEVGGLLNLVGIVIKRRGLGGLGRWFRREAAKKIPRSIKIKNSAALNKKYTPSKIEERSGVVKYTDSPLPAWLTLKLPYGRRVAVFLPFLEIFNYTRWLRKRGKLSSTQDHQTTKHENNTDNIALYSHRHHPFQ